MFEKKIVWVYNKGEHKGGNIMKHKILLEIIYDEIKKIDDDIKLTIEINDDEELICLIRERYRLRTIIRNYNRELKKGE